MTLRDQPVPAEQLFRVLLLRLLETHMTLIPIVRSTTSQALKLCHQQNAYSLSEIESWLAEQVEELSLSPSYSRAELAELQDGVASCMILSQAQTSGVPMTVPVPIARMDTRRGSRQGRSSRRSASLQLGLERTPDGKIIFRQRS